MTPVILSVDKAGDLKIGTRKCRTYKKADVVKVAKKFDINTEKKTIQQLCSSLKSKATMSGEPKKAKTKAKTKEQKEKEIVEAFVKIMEGPDYEPLIYGSENSKFSKISKKAGITWDVEYRLKKRAASLVMRRKKAAEKAAKKAAEKAAEEARERYEAAREQWEKKKKAETLYMNASTRNMFNALTKSKDAKSLRQAYLKGAFKLHPDKGGNAELFKKFKAIYNKKKLFA